MHKDLSGLLSLIFIFVVLCTWRLIQSLLGDSPAFQNYCCGIEVQLFFPPGKL